MKGSLTARVPGVWKIGVYLGVGPDGKQIRKFETIKGNKGAAQRRLRELLIVKDKGLPVKTAKLTLGAWVERWLAEYVRPKNGQHTYESYHRLLQRHVLLVLGQVEFTKLTPSHIESLEA